MFLSHFPEHATSESVRTARNPCRAGAAAPHLTLTMAQNASENWLSRPEHASKEVHSGSDGLDARLCPRRFRHLSDTALV